MIAFSNKMKSNECISFAATQSNVVTLILMHTRPELKFNYESLSMFLLRCCFFSLSSFRCYVCAFASFLVLDSIFANQYASTNYRESNACDDWICLFFAPSIKLISLAQNFHSIHSNTALLCCRALYNYFFFEGMVWLHFVLPVIVYIIYVCILGAFSHWVSQAMPPISIDLWTSGCIST